MFNAEQISFFSLDQFFQHYPAWASVNIDGYPLTAVAWNFILLLIPIVLAMLLKKLYLKNSLKKVGGIIGGALLFLAWVLFAPNTAYVITEVRHLLDYCPISSDKNVCLNNAWMIMVFFIYASFGWIFFVVALKQMKNLITQIFNNKVSSLFVLLIIPLIALGVLLGLLQRFNSWDLFFFPLLIFENMLLYFNNQVYFTNFIVFSTGLYLLYFLGDLLFKDYYFYKGSKDDDFNKKY